MVSNGVARGRPGRTPQLLTLGLLVVICILAFNYWNVSSRSRLLQRQVQEMTVTLEELAMKKVHLEKRSEALQSQIGDANKVNSLLKTEKESCAQERDQINRGKDELMNQVGSLMKEKQTAQSSLENFRSNASHSIQLLMEMKAKYEALRSEHEKIGEVTRMESAKQEHTIQDLQQETRRNYQAIQVYEQQKQELSLTIGELRNQVAMLQDQCGAARQQQQQQHGCATTPRHVWYATGDKPTANTGPECSTRPQQQLQRQQEYYQQKQEEQRYQQQLMEREQLQQQQQQQLQQQGSSSHRQMTATSCTTKITTNVIIISSPRRVQSATCLTQPAATHFVSHGEYLTVYSSHRAPEGNQIEQPVKQQQDPGPIQMEANADNRREPENPQMFPEREQEQGDGREGKRARVVPRSQQQTRGSSREAEAGEEGGEAGGDAGAGEGEEGNGVGQQEPDEGQAGEPDQDQEPGSDLSEVDNGEDRQNGGEEVDQGQVQAPDQGDEEEEDESSLSQVDKVDDKNGVREEIELQEEEQDARIDAAEIDQEDEDGGGQDEYGVGREDEMEVQMAEGEQDDEAKQYEDDDVDYQGAEEEEEEEMDQGMEVRDGDDAEDQNPANGGDYDQVDNVGEEVAAGQYEAGDDEQEDGGVKDEEYNADQNWDNGAGEEGEDVQDAAGQDNYGAANGELEEGADGNDDDDDDEEDDDYSMDGMEEVENNMEDVDNGLMEEDVADDAEIRDSIGRDLKEHYNYQGDWRIQLNAVDQSGEEDEVDEEDARVNDEAGEVRVVDEDNGEENQGGEEEEPDVGIPPVPREDNRLL
ncbi:LOW QUALITY PROTEIN: uncharacterized protein [Diadema setosum]|uniref:LOW QUALITY PROTEIN: uncharacterized protein n=1 Tax=Diadema setosum TaxID=31175 RepID=UPI003B3AC2BD